MKPYEKPKLIAFSLAGNERLCVDCSNEPAKEWDSAIMNNFLWMNNLGSLLDDGVVTQAEFESIFSSGEGCKTETTSSEYCKFTGAITVAWS